MSDPARPGPALPPSSRGRRALRRGRRRVVGAIAAAVGATLLAPGARGDFPPDVADRVQAQLGTIIARLDTEIGVNVADGAVGTTIRFEQAFGLPETNYTFRLDGTWRISGRHSLDFGYMQFNRANTTRLAEEIVFAGATFQADAEVRGSFESRFPIAAYRYDMLYLPEVRIAFSGGVSYLRLAAGLDANGGVIAPDGTVITGSYEADEELEYPVPIVGLRVDWAIARRLALEMYNRYFYLDRSDITGDMIEGGVRLTWFFHRNVGIGGGFERTTITIRSYEDDDYEARFDYTLQGVNLFLKAAF